MNWGKGIIISLVAFIAFILYLAITLMTHKVDLESEDYYQQEIAYDEKIDALNNANKLADKITYQVIDEHLVFSIPDDSFKEIQLDFARPDDKLQDKSYTIEGTNTYLIDTKELKKGIYKLDISYKQGENICLQQEKIYIQ